MLYCKSYGREACARGVVQVGLCSEPGVVQGVVRGPFDNSIFVLRGILEIENRFLSPKSMEFDNSEVRFGFLGSENPRIQFLKPFGINFPWILIDFLCFLNDFG